MSRRGADEVSESPQLQARLLPPAGPAQMNAAERDRLIAHLAGKGWNHSKIGRAVGLTRRGVGMALQRIAEGRPGRVRGE
jgi:transcriptional regulator with GAF, ATPase, and Fis domain